MKIPGRIWLLILMIVIGIAPMLSVILAGAIAEANACDLHEGFAQPCLVMGIEMGQTLYTMTVMGWLMLVSLFFLAGGVLGLLWEGLVFIGRRLLQPPSP